MGTARGSADRPTSTEAVVHTRALARRFGARWVVSGVDVDVPRGGALMITGANGSGKTTLLRCIATAIQAQHGTLRLFGREGWADRAAVRPRMALVSHATRLYDDLSARDNLLAWARLGGLTADVPALLERVGLPNDRTEPVRAFSAGMRRRLALALGLLKNPELMLLDEPFSALDPQGRELVAGVLRDLRAGGVTLVLATHLPEIAGAHCDQALHLDRGRVVSAPAVS